MTAKWRGVARETEREREKEVDSLGFGLVGRSVTSRIKSISQSRESFLTIPYTFDPQASGIDHASFVIASANDDVDDNNNDNDHPKQR